VKSMAITMFPEGTGRIIRVKGPIVEEVVKTLVSMRRNLILIYMPLRDMIYRISFQERIDT
jgi:hypothetical protein